MASFMSSNRRHSVVLAAVIAVAFCAAAFAGGPVVSTRFFHSVDIADFGACTWAEGRPAPNREVEAAVRTQVESSLEAKGYSMSSEEADCTVTSQAVREGNFPVGMLLIEIHEKRSGTLAWRGEAAGLVNYDTKQLKKKARKVVKTMFKDFPKARLGG